MLGSALAGVSGVRNRWRAFYVVRTTSIDSLREQLIHASACGPGTRPVAASQTCAGAGGAGAGRATRQGFPPAPRSGITGTSTGASGDRGPWHPQRHDDVAIATGAPASSLSFASCSTSREQQHGAVASPEPVAAQHGQASYMATFTPGEGIVPTTPRVAPSRAAPMSMMAISQLGMCELSGVQCDESTQNQGRTREG